MAVAIPEEDVIVVFFTQSRGSRTPRQWIEAALSAVR
jgi:hypothetical protein